MDLLTHATRIQNERDSYANTLVEIRQMLGITDNEVWTQEVLKQKLDRLEELEGHKPDLSVVEPKK